MHDRNRDIDRRLARSSELSERMEPSGTAAVENLRAAARALRRERFLQRTRTGAGLDAEALDARQGWRRDGD